MKNQMNLFNAKAVTKPMKRSQREKAWDAYLKEVMVILEETKCIETTAEILCDRCIANPEGTASTHRQLYDRLQSRIVKRGWLAPSGIRYMKNSWRVCYWQDYGPVKEQIKTALAGQPKSLPDKFPTMPSMPMPRVGVFNEGFFLVLVSASAFVVMGLLLWGIKFVLS
jgi:hypothetical protein